MRKRDLCRSVCSLRRAKMNLTLKSFLSKARKRNRVETMTRMTTMTRILKRTKAAHLFPLQVWVGTKSKATAFRQTLVISSKDEVGIKKK